MMVYRNIKKFTVSMLNFSQKVAFCIRYTICSVAWEPSNHFFLPHNDTLVYRFPVLSPFSKKIYNVLGFHSPGHIQHVTQARCSYLSCNSTVAQVTIVFMQFNILPLSSNSASCFAMFFLEHFSPNCSIAGTNLDVQQN